MQVETLFHEFGHAAQHMLTEQQEGLVAGIRGVEWDAVELPSQVRPCPGAAGVTGQRDRLITNRCAHPCPACATSRLSIY